MCTLGVSHTVSARSIAIWAKLYFEIVAPKSRKSVALACKILNVGVTKIFLLDLRGF